MIALLVIIGLVTPAAETARIQVHLLTVDRELREADTSGLSDLQLVKRESLRLELARYRDRGVFPRNLDFDRATPFFIDDRGVRCAMAHLIETHGGAALVGRVAATANNAYVPELAGDPALIAWLDDHGLTVAEAARIQPAYSRSVGENCEGGYYSCTGGVCEPTPDQPGLSYCAITCDPAGDACPVGVQGIAMECQPRGDGYLCVYPLPSPGSDGWPCDYETSEVCAWNCLPNKTNDEGDGDGICVSACSDIRACPAEYECEPKQNGSNSADYLRSCMPIKKGGCNAATPAQLIVCLLAIPVIRRRRRRTRSFAPR